MIEEPCKPNSLVTSCVVLVSAVIVSAILVFPKECECAGNVIVSPAAVLLSKKTVFPSACPPRRSKTVYSSSTKEPNVAPVTELGFVLPYAVFPTTAVFACTFEEYSTGPNVSLFDELDGT